MSSDNELKLPVEYSDTTRYKLLTSGAIYDNESKRICAKLPGVNDITQATASDYHRMRQQKIIDAQLAAQDGVVKALKTPSAMAAWSVINGKQAHLAVDVKKNPHASTKASAFVGKAMGFIDEKIQEAQSGLSVSNDSLETIRDIISLMRDLKY